MRRQREDIDRGRNDLAGLFQWQIEIRRLGEVESTKLPRGHADDGGELVVDDQRLADDRRIAVESPLPESLRQYCHEWCFTAIVSRFDRPAERGSHAEDG